MGKRRLETGQPAVAVDSLLGKPVEGELDLHGHDSRSAEVALESFISRWSQTRSGAVVRVITGRGNRSGGAPVLQPVVARLLAGRLAQYVNRHTVDRGGGAFLVQVR